MSNSYVKSLMNWMVKNKENNARIVVDDLVWKNVYILPSYKNIRKETAAKIIADLGLQSIPGYKDYPRHDMGSVVYVFKENTNKY